MTSAPIEQAVIRDGRTIRIVLTCAGDPVPRETYGPVTRFTLPEPVQAAAGEIVIVDLAWLPKQPREDAAQPMYISSDATIATVFTGPSLFRPGTQALAVGDRNARLGPDA